LIKINSIKNNWLIIIQVRNGSSRLPFKSFLKIYDKPLIEIMIERLLPLFDSKRILLATTKLKKDKLFIKIANKFNIKFFKGSNKNVLKRYMDIIKKYKLKNIVRLTGDCPLIDAALLKRMLKYFYLNKLDYLSNCYPYNKRTFPVGCDVEIINSKVLEYINNSKPNIYEKEHVTTKILKYYKKFKCEILKNKINYSNIRYTVDYLEDYLVVKEIYKYLKEKKKKKK